MNNFKIVENVRISITHSCNLMCEYCSDNNSKTNLNVVQDINGIIDFLKKLPKLKLILLYGGEPLLYNNIIYILNQLLEELPNVKIGIFTNGTIWNEDFAKILKINPNVFVNFTRANSKESQDIHRRFKNGSGSYDIVTKNLYKYSLINPNKISMMTTVTQDFIGELYNGVIDDYKYTPNVYINLVVSEEEFTNHQKLEDNLIKIANYALDHREVVIRNFFKCSNNDPIWFKKNYNIAIQKTYSEFVNGIKNILIDVDGKIYASTSLQGTEHWMADIYNNINYKELEFYQSVREKGICSKCQYRYTCQPFYEVYNPYDTQTPYKIEAYCKITEIYAKIQDYYFKEAKNRFFDKENI